MNKSNLTVTYLFLVQSRTEDKIERFKKAVEYFSAASKPRPLTMGPSPYLRKYCSHG